VQALATGWHDDPQTGPLLRERVTTDPDRDVRRAAVQGLTTGWRDDPGTGRLNHPGSDGDSVLSGGWRDDPIFEAPS